MPFLAALPWKWISYGLLALACGLLWLRGNHYETKAENCRIGRENDRAAYALASKEAEAKAIAQKQAVEARYKREAEETDANYQTALARAQRASDAYASRMRNAAVKRPTSGTTAPAPSNTPEGPDRSGADAVLVGRDDFDILVENSVRLEAAHDWAATLNHDPIPDPAFGGQ